MSDQELQAFLEEIALAVHLEPRATRTCMVVMGSMVILCCWLLS
jgi:hypothetical protein